MFNILQVKTAIFILFTSYQCLSVLPINEYDLNKVLVGYYCCQG